MSATRTATHARSWYSSDRASLDRQLTNWLANVHPSDEYQPPVKGCKAIIAPHAGYSYSGPAAAWAYKAIDTTGIKRVFILGPAHHVYLPGCALSQFKSYDTPLGELALDLETIAELRATNKFPPHEMTAQTDEDEHSIELHLPYVRKVFESTNGDPPKDIKIVPILIGAINEDQEREYGELLAPYFAREDTFIVVSSDFCHWGKRFNYTFYYPSPPRTSLSGVISGTRLTLSNARSTISPSFPIYKSITALDNEAMDILTLPTVPLSRSTSPIPSRSRSNSVIKEEKTPAAQAHAAFASYLRRTKNTICGRHPIGVLLGALGTIERDGLWTKGRDEKHEVKMQFVRYEHSSECEGVEDSSVSYASAYVVF